VFDISDGQNQIAIRFNRDLNHIDSLIQTLHHSVEVFYDSILIRFRNFSDLLQQKRDIS